MWEQIRSNRRKSVFLVLCIAALLLFLGLVIGEAWQPGAGLLGVAVALVLWTVLSLTAYFRGGDILLAVSGAKEITHDDHPRLFNVVEEMKIAAALPKMPKVYLIDDMAMNAFATGRSPDDAAVAVTAGLLGRLNRDELQGVVAHEMSHILNRDVLLMSMVGVTLGALVMISQVFLRSLYFGGSSRRYRSSRANGGQALILVVAIVGAILAPILAQLIYFAVSRRREYLADANAAVLTRYPEGLASALEKLSVDTQVLARANRATAPMYIVNPLRKANEARTGLTSTHPPIEERVRVLRTIIGSVSYQQYEAAWRTTRGNRGSIMPASALASDQANPIRQAMAPETQQTPRQQVREAGDLLRKVNQFLFLPCACGLRIKLPPDFKKPQIECPRCHRLLTAPVAQMVAAGAVAQAVAGRPEQPVPAQPLAITRSGTGWMSFKCPCGTTQNIAPSFAGNQIACSHCGRKIQIRRA
jgi:heat shock protein HtpX